MNPPAERVVVCFRTQVTSVAGDDGRSYLDRAKAIRERAEALGGTLCAWSAQTFAFDFGADDLEEALTLAGGAAEAAASLAATSDATIAKWSVAVSQGVMFPLAETGSMAFSSWGPPLVIAVSLARIARPGDVLIDPDMPCLKQGDVLTVGSRLGKDGARRVRGLLLDVRETWRRDAALNVKRLVAPAWVGQGGMVEQLLSQPGTVAVVRAEAGLGGTRLLAEVAEALLPARTLLLSPAGAEPMGSLRRVVARETARHGFAQEIDDMQKLAVDQLLAGRGIDLEKAAELVETWLAPREPGLRAGAVLIDDAADVDAASLNAVARAIKRRTGEQAMSLIVRLDSSAPLPTQLAVITSGPEVKLAPLDRPAAEQLAAACAEGRLSAEAAQRFAQRGKWVPLGIVESLAEGLTTGELSWTDEVAVPRQRGAGSRRTFSPSDWIAKRLAFVSPAGLSVLGAVALLGGDASLSLIEKVLAGAGRESVDLSLEAEELLKTRWLSSPEAGWLSLPSKTHREVILAKVLEGKKAEWHRAASQALQSRGDTLAGADAARHAELAGDHPRAVDLGLAAARVALEAGLESAADALVATFGAGPASVRQGSRSDGPRSETPRSVSQTPAVAAAEARSSEPPPASETFARSERPAGMPEREEVTERREAIAALSRGATSEALRVLREALAKSHESAPSERCRAALAYGVALAAAGRASEALLEGLDALARAREGGDARGEEACARFLAKLAAGAGDAAAQATWERLAAQPTLGQAV